MNERERGEKNCFDVKRNGVMSFGSFVLFSFFLIIILKFIVHFVVCFIFVFHSLFHIFYFFVFSCFLVFFFFAFLRERDRDFLRDSLEVTGIVNWFYSLSFVVLVVVVM